MSGQLTWVRRPGEDRYHAVKCDTLRSLCGEPMVGAETAASAVSVERAGCPLCQAWLQEEERQRELCETDR